MGDAIGRHRPKDHHALHTQVQDTRTFGKDFANRGKENTGACANTGGKRLTMRANSMKLPCIMRKEYRCRFYVEAVLMSADAPNGHPPCRPSGFSYLALTNQSGLARERSPTFALLGSPAHKTHTIVEHHLATDHHKENHPLQQLGNARGLDGIAADQ